MPSIFSHGIAAFALGKITLLKNQSWKIWILGITCSIVPDADTISFLFGIPYESLWGHRGFTHSFLFALLLAVIVMFLFFRNIKINHKEYYIILFYFFLATASHPILDAFTNGGLGVAFFAPFDESRYFFPWRPVQVSPIGAKFFFSEAGIKVIKSEFIWIWVPSFVLIVVGSLLGKTKNQI